MAVTISHDMTVKLVDSMGDDASICRAAKVSTEGEKSLEAETKEGLLKFLMKNRHGSPFEHNSMTFFVKAPITVLREFFRHRVGWSYNEQSGRYMELPAEFYIPPPERPLVQVGKPGAYSFVPGTDQQYARLVEVMSRQFQSDYDDYQRMLCDGIAKEVARGILPLDTYSTAYTTCNARSLMHFLSLRSKDDKSTFPSYPMWEIEQVALKMEQVFATLFPITSKLFREFGSVAP